MIALESYLAHQENWLLGYTHVPKKQCSKRWKVPIICVWDLLILFVCGGGGGGTHFWPVLPESRIHCLIPSQLCNPRSVGGEAGGGGLVQFFFLALAPEIILVNLGVYMISYKLTLHSRKTWPNLWRHSTRILSEFAQIPPEFCQNYYNGLLFCLGGGGGGTVPPVSNAYGYHSEVK